MFSVDQPDAQTPLSMCGRANVAKLLNAASHQGLWVKMEIELRFQVFENGIPMLRRLADEDEYRIVGRYDLHLSSVLASFVENVEVSHAGNAGALKSGGYRD